MVRRVRTILPLFLLILVPLVIQGTVPMAAASSVSHLGAWPVLSGVGSPQTVAPNWNYDEQLAETFTQSYTSLAFTVGATIQTDSSGYGPAYLLNGLTAAQGYWYQVGLGYDIPFCGNGGYTAGFSLVYEVFNSNDHSVFPTNGCGGVASFTGTVTEGDHVVLSLAISGGNVIMKAQDVGYGQLGATVIASASESYSAEGETGFIGLPTSPSDQYGHFSGFMTELFSVNSNNAQTVREQYMNFGSPLTSAWMEGDEFDPFNGGQPCAFSSTQSPLSFTGSPTTLQSFSVCGSTLQGDDYLFMTGTSTNQVTKPTFTCILLASSCPTSATVAPGSDIKIETDAHTDTTPSTVQFFVNGGGGSIMTWNIASTGWTFINDYGPISTAGTYSIYSVTTYKDGSQQTSNTVTLTIT